MVRVVRYNIPIFFSGTKRENFVNDSFGVLRESNCTGRLSWRADNRDMRLRPGPTMSVGAKAEHDDSCFLEHFDRHSFDNVLHLFSISEHMRGDSMVL